MKLCPNVKMPSHAYVPGQTRRHSENAFEAIRATAVQGDNADQLASCEAFRTGLHFLGTGYYWEAHEVLEPVWMILPDDTEERRFVQGLIQLANGHLKLRMGRPSAALRLVGQARGLVASDATPTIMTLDVQEVNDWIDELETIVLLAL